MGVGPRYFGCVRWSWPHLEHSGVSADFAERARFRGLANKSDNATLLYDPGSSGTSGNPKNSGNGSMHDGNSTTSGGSTPSAYMSSIESSYDTASFDLIVVAFIPNLALDVLSRRTNAAARRRHSA